MCRQRVACGIVAAVIVAGGVGMAQDSPYPIFTVDHLGTTMKALGPNFRATNAALADQDYQTAKERITRSREQLATTITFWRQNDKNDAIAILRETVSKMDDLDAVLSVEMVNEMAATGLIGEIGMSCRACHDLYREQDPDTNEYRLKLGSVE